MNLLRHIKNLTLTIVAFMGLLTAQAQSVDVVTGLNVPYGLALNGSELYIAEMGGNQISKADISVSSPSATNVISVHNPLALLLNGNELYIGQWFPGKISKVDISISSPSDTDVVTGILPYAFELDGNNLYAVQSSSVSLINLMDSMASLNTIISGLSGARDILLNGNKLYIAESGANKISQVDLSASTLMTIDIVTGLSNPSAIALKGNELYIAEKNTNKISRIDISSSSPTPTDVVTGLSSPVELLIESNDLYVVEQAANKVSKVNLSTLSARLPDAIENSLTLSPNPATDYLELSGFKGQLVYSIHDTEGKVVNQGNVSQNQKVVISNLKKGTYFIRSERSKAIKFIKR
ncbi:MAG: T9SS type A sorting domain-containing protein [Vicingaceae bacterium]